MKIGILTQPLHTNYGGLLQCFALQTVLKRLGHDVWIVQRIFSRMTFWSYIKFYIKQVIRFLIGRQLLIIMSDKQEKTISKCTSLFINRFIQPKTPLLYSTKALKEYHKTAKFDAYIVGSDQVWRPIYSPCITNYFLDFLSEKENIKRVSYAASFGVEDWEFSKVETQVCADLLKQFDGVSVREASAVDLCKKYLGYANAVHVLDPTMLLEKEDYIRLVEEEKEPESKGDLFYYILDASTEKQDFVSKVSHQMGYIPFTQMPKCPINRQNINERIEDCVYPSVTAWLRAFMDAKMIITDSFHGCVFSIIFNKPFWVIGNPSRGMARFHSLLSTYGLTNRLITSNQFPSDFLEKIDWIKVNAIRKNLQKDSLDFINCALQ